MNYCGLVVLDPDGGAIKGITDEAKLADNAVLSDGLKKFGG